MLEDSKLVAVNLATTKMSFSDLKKNKGNVFNSLQKQLEQSTKVGSVDERFWKPTTDKAGNGYAIIRFLPAVEGEDMPFVKLYSHASHPMMAQKRPIIRVGQTLNALRW